MKKPEEYLTPMIADAIVHGRPTLVKDTVLALIARVQRDAVECCDKKLSEIEKDYYLTAQDAYDRGNSDAGYKMTGWSRIINSARTAIRALLPEVTK